MPKTPASTARPAIVLRNAATGNVLQMAEGALSAETIEQGVQELLPAK